MKNSLSLALAAFIFCSASAFAAASPASPAESPNDQKYAFADKALDAVALRINEVKKCIDYLESLKADLKSAKEQAAEANGGSIPLAYNDEFAVKTARVSKVYTSCAKLDLDQTVYDQARIALHSVQPSNAPGIPKRRERFKALLTLSNASVKRLHINPGSSKPSH